MPATTPLSMISKKPLLKRVFILLIISLPLILISCQKEYYNNSEEIALLREIKSTDSLLLIQYKGLQKQVDSLLKINYTSQLSSIKTTLDSVQSKLTIILSQLTTANSNISDIKSQLNELLKLYQSLLTAITNIKCGNNITDSLKVGLLAYYSFDNNLIDSSGNNYSGIANGNVKYVLDHNSNSNRALEILSGYILLGVTPKLEFSKEQNLSITGWVMIADPTNGGRIVSSENSEGNLRLSVWQSGTKKYIQFAFGNSGVIADNISTNTWYNFTYTYDKIAGSKVYINGIKTSENAQLNTEVRAYNGYRFGQKNAPAYDQFYGKIDELRFYNRVLSNAEIEYLSK